MRPNAFGFVQRRTIGKQGRRVAVFAQSEKNQIEARQLFLATTKKLPQLRSYAAAAAAGSSSPVMRCTFSAGMAIFASRRFLRPCENCSRHDPAPRSARHPRKDEFAASRAAILNSAVASKRIKRFRRRAAGKRDGEAIRARRSLGAPSATNCSAALRLSSSTSRQMIISSVSHRRETRRNRRRRAAPPDRSAPLARE